jgi:hypothetical protein
MADPKKASEAAWDGNAADYPTPESYCSACLIDANDPGAPKAKGRCHLPVKTKDGTLNRTAMGAAAAALVGARGGVKVTPAQKKSAARKLLGYYRQINADPPPALKTLGS